MLVGNRRMAGTGQLPTGSRFIGMSLHRHLLGENLSRLFKSG
jgi:hypothetical protein